MFKRGATILVLPLVLSGCGTGRKSQWESPQPPAATVAKTKAVEPANDADAGAENSWQGRSSKAALQDAIARWESILSANPADGPTWAKLSRAYYFLADGHLRADPKSDAYLDTFEKGTGAGERALAAISPEFKARMVKGDKVEDAIKVVGADGLAAMYWYAVNLSKWSKAKGLAALLGNKERVKAVVSRVLELDEKFFHGAPHRYFGAYWALVPVGRDLDKSKEHFDKSLVLAPHYAGTKVLMAESYAVKKQDKALFLKLLDEVLAMPEDAIADLVAETRVEKDKAKELKAKADELF